MAVSEEVVGGRGKGLSSRTDRSGNWEARKKELISTLLSGISSCIFSSCFLQPPPPASMALCLHTGEKAALSQTHLPKEDHLTLVASGRPRLYRRGHARSFIHLFTQHIFIDDVGCTKPCCRCGRDSGEQDRSSHRVHGADIMGASDTRNCTFPWRPPSGSMVHAPACLGEGTFSITHSFVPAALGSEPRSHDTDEGGPMPRALTPGTIHLRGVQA